MATTIDQLSSLAHPSWREAVARTARQRISSIPDARLRSRQVGLLVMDGALIRSAHLSGVAAYARQREQFGLWKEAVTAHPVRALPAPTAAKPLAAKGALLDLRL